jgi:hypothetical protein
MPEQQTNMFAAAAPPRPYLPNQPVACDRCGVDVAPPAFQWEGEPLCPDCQDTLLAVCSVCGGYVPRPWGVEAEDCSFYCDRCYLAWFAQCYGCGKEIPRATSYTNPDGSRQYCRDCFSMEFSTCGCCHRVVDSDDCRRTPEGSDWCATCWRESCATCHDCGNIIWLDDVHWVQDHPYCQGCNREASEWESKGFQVETPVYDRIQSRRRFGVELETSQCNDYRELHEETIWECKHDCSIDGMEFVSPILYGDQGLTEIENFCAEARRRRWRVNNRCGFHAHFDVSDESEDSLKAIAWAYRMTYPLWCRLVPEDRSDNSMCGRPDYHVDDILNEDCFEYFVGRQDRFEFVNWRAYLVHGSFEVRLYQGTLSAEEICNWVKLHARFIDAVRLIRLDQLHTVFNGEVYHDYEVLTNMVGHDLANYWALKAVSLGHTVRNEVCEVFDWPTQSSGGYWSVQSNASYNY